VARKYGIKHGVYHHDAQRQRAQPAPRERTQRDVAKFIHRQTIDMAVAWVDPPIGATPHENPLFRCIKNNSRLRAAILRSDPSPSMCGLQARRYKCFDSATERTSAERLFLW
jgi:hypothetical protein